MNNLNLWRLLVFCIAFLVTSSANGQPKISLTLTYPDGMSPNVFTEGWVFGAKAIADPGGPNERDVSNIVQWSGSGTFDPAVGGLSRPVFVSPGPNVITLSVTVEGRSVTERISVNAVSPYGMNFNDFYFKEAAIEQTPFLIRISDKAKDVYPQSKFVEGSQWVAQIDYSGADEKGQVFKLKAPILLTVRGNYTSSENLYGFYPALRSKKNLKTFNFSEISGLATITEGPATIVVGPITPGWSDLHKQESVQAAKTVLANFDCFVAHVTYSGADSDKINTFRNFRDKVLQQTEEGRHLVRLYYEYGFDYAARLRSRPLYIPATRAILDRVAAYVEGLDLDDPETTRELNRAVHWVDRGVSLFYEEGASEGLGQFSQFAAPILWEK